jgi:hypothetical protein
MTFMTQPLPQLASWTARSLSPIAGPPAYPNGVMLRSAAERRVSKHARTVVRASRRRFAPPQHDDVSRRRVPRLLSMTKRATSAGLIFRPGSKALDCRPVTRDQRLLLGARPALDAPLGGNRVVDVLELLGPKQLDRRRIAV